MSKLTTNQATKIILPELIQTELCSATNKNRIVVEITEPVLGETLNYHINPISKSGLERYHHFPIVLKSDASP